MECDEGWTCRSKHTRNESIKVRCGDVSYGSLRVSVAKHDVCCEQGEWVKDILGLDQHWAFRSREEGRRQREERANFKVNVHIWKLRVKSQREDEKVSIQRGWGEIWILTHHGIEREDDRKWAGLAGDAGVR